MHGFVFEEICLCLTSSSFAYGINACRLPKKTNIVFYSHVRWSHFSHAALANEKEKERKKIKIAIFLLVMFCQVCLLKKKVSRQNTRIKAVSWSQFSHAALANEKKDRKKKKNCDFLSSKILSSLSNEKNF